MNTQFNAVLQRARFFTTVDQLHQLPSLGLPEIAFAGRSNSGKSSAINRLCHQRNLAFASKTPGRTQHLNFYAIGEHPDDRDIPAAFLVDLPGYGYAQVSRSNQAHWERTLGAYIRHRSELRALVLIMDARRPLTELDVQMIEWFSPTGKPMHALLTKADKLNRSERAAALGSTIDSFARLGEQYSAQLFSSLTPIGIEEAQQRVLELVARP